MSSVFGFAATKVVSAVNAVGTFYTELNPSTLSGAIDVIVVRQPNGELICSPFHVRFGKIKLLQPQDKMVTVTVNDQITDIPMKVGEAGEAFFVVEVRSSNSDQLLPELSTSPLHRSDLNAEIAPAPFLLEASEYTLSQSICNDSSNLDLLSPTPTPAKKSINDTSYSDFNSETKKDSSSLINTVPESNLFLPKNDQNNLNEASIQNLNSELASSINISNNDMDFYISSKLPLAEDVTDRFIQDANLVGMNQSNDIPNLSEYPQTVNTNNNFLDNISNNNDNNNDNNNNNNNNSNGNSNNLNITHDRFTSQNNIDNSKIEYNVNDNKNAYGRFSNTSPKPRTQSLNRLNVKTSKSTQEDEEEMRKDNSFKDTQAKNDINEFSMSPKPMNKVTKYNVLSNYIKEKMSVEISSKWKSWFDLAIIDIVALDYMIGRGDYEAASNLFESSKININDDHSKLNEKLINACLSKDSFTSSDKNIKTHLVVRLDKYYYLWETIAFIIFHSQSFGFSMDSNTIESIELKMFGHIAEQISIISKNDDKKKTPIKQPSRFGNLWSSSWWSKAGTPTELDSVEKVDESPSSSSAIDIAPRSNIHDLNANFDPNFKSKVSYAKSLRLTSAQLMKLNLNPGPNSVKFEVVNAGFQGTATCSANIFLYDYNAKIVISDIDGTITKSDALGHLFTMVGKDWTHPGIARLFTNIRDNGYHVMYLTSRAIGQSSVTRDYLGNIQQNGCKLPVGPVIMSPDRLFASFHREVIQRRPEEFKMACLRDIRRLFLVEGNESPFWAGFGNRITDGLSYRSVNVPISRIFTIDPNGEIKLELLIGYKSSYMKLNDLVDQIFPPIIDPCCGHVGFGTFAGINMIEDVIPLRISANDSNINSIKYDRISDTNSRVLSSDEDITDSEHYHTKSSSITSEFDSDKAYKRSKSLDRSKKPSFYDFDDNDSSLTFEDKLKDINLTEELKKQKYLLKKKETHRKQASDLARRSAAVANTSIEVEYNDWNFWRTDVNSFSLEDISDIEETSINNFKKKKGQDDNFDGYISRDSSAMNSPSTGSLLSTSIKERGSHSPRKDNLSSDSIVSDDERTHFKNKSYESMMNKVSSNNSIEIINNSNISNQGLSTSLNEKLNRNGDTFATESMNLSKSIGDVHIGDISILDDTKNVLKTLDSSAKILVGGTAALVSATKDAILEGVDNISSPIIDNNESHNQSPFESSMIADSYATDDDTDDSDSLGGVDLEDLDIEEMEKTLGHL